MSNDLGLGCDTTARSVERCCSGRSGPLVRTCVAADLSIVFDATVDRLVDVMLWATGVRKPREARSAYLVESLLDLEPAIDERRSQISELLCKGRHYF